MVSEIAVNTPRALDEFEGWTDEVESEGEQYSERSIIGQRLRFSNEGKWLLPDGTELEKPLIVVDIRRSVVKWKPDKGAPETSFLKEGEAFPDLRARNEGTPKAEWIKGFNGELKGPWEAQHIAYLVDPVSLDHHTFPTSTTGGGIAVRELVNRTLLMRRFRGNAVYPIVRLATHWMRTKYAGRLRPHFEIVGWTAFEPNNDRVIEAAQPQQQLARPVVEQSASQTQSSEQPAGPLSAASTQAERLKAVLNIIGAKTVEPPTLKEELRDEIKF